MIKNMKIFLMFSLINYLSINSIIVKSSFNSYIGIPILFKIAYLIFLIVLLSIFLKFHIREEIFYPIVFIIFGFINIKNVNKEYFWNTIPDARTYKNLGETLLDCFQLSLSCNTEPYL